MGKKDKRDTKKPLGFDPTKVGGKPALTGFDFTKSTRTTPKDPLADLFGGGTDSGFRLSSVSIASSELHIPATVIELPKVLVVEQSASPSRIRPMVHKAVTFDQDWPERYSEWNEMVQHLEKLFSQERRKLRGIINHPNVDLKQFTSQLIEQKPELAQALGELKGKRDDSRVKEKAIDAILPSMIQNSQEWADVGQAACRIIDSACNILKAIAHYHKMEISYENGEPTTKALLGEPFSGTIKFADGKPPMEMAQASPTMETLRQFINTCQGMIRTLANHTDPAKPGERIYPAPDLNAVHNYSEAISQFTVLARKDPVLLGDTNEKLSKEESRAREAERARLDKNEQESRPVLMGIVNLVVEDWTSALAEWRKEPNSKETTVAIERLRFTLHDIAYNCYEMGGGKKAAIDNDPEVAIERKAVEAATLELDKSPATNAQSLRYMIRQAYGAYEATHLWEKSKASPNDVQPALEELMRAAKLYNASFNEPKIEPVTETRSPRVLTDEARAAAVMPVIVVTPGKEPQK